MAHRILKSRQTSDDKTRGYFIYFYFLKHSYWSWNRSLTNLIHRSSNIWFVRMNWHYNPKIQRKYFGYYIYCWLGQNFNVWSLHHLLKSLMIITKGEKSPVQMNENVVNFTLVYHCHYPSYFSCIYVTAKAVYFLGFNTLY